jgi:hypothetical protein
MSRPLRIAWVLLLLLGLFFLFAPAAELAADARDGIAKDHQTTFTKLAGADFTSVQQSAPGTARYSTLLERGYALHEPTFGLLFLAILGLPVPAPGALSPVGLLGGADRQPWLHPDLWPA